MTARRTTRKHSTVDDPPPNLTVLQVPVGGDIPERLDRLAASHGGSSRDKIAQSILLAALALAEMAA